MNAADDDWPRRRVLQLVATGGQPGPRDEDLVAVLVDRGLLARAGDGVVLCELGRVVA